MENMEWVTGDFSGITADQYELLKDLEWFADWVDNFTPVRAGNGIFYEFSEDVTGDDGDFLVEAEDNGFEDGLTYFVYIKSTNSVGGF